MEVQAVNTGSVADYAARQSDISAHRTDVQGLRGVAVLLVVSYHAKLWTSGGFVGVDVFFVISGFVITASLMRELEHTNRIGFRAFYRRRIKRLLPALAVVLVATSLLAALTLSPFGPQIPAAKTGIAASLFASNLYLFTSPSGYFGAPAAVNPLLHMWSLSVEEQFYLGYPLLVSGLWWVARRRARDSLDRARRSLTIGLGAIAALSLVMCIVLTSLTPGRFGFAEPARLAFYAPVTRAWEFIAGALVALLTPRISRSASRLGNYLGAAGVALVAVAAWRFSEFTAFPGVAAMVPVLGAALVIVSGTVVADGPLQRALGWSPLVWVGDVSYGWYLWHWPLIVAARMLWPSSRSALVAAAVVALIPTVVSYRYLENRIRFSPRVRGPRVVALAVACVLVPLLALSGLRWGASYQWQRQQLKTANAQFGLHADELRGCSAPGAIDLSQCTWPVVGDATGSMVLVGDSNAGQFSEAVLRAASEMGLNTTIATSSGCPFVALTMSRPGAGYDDDCTARVKGVTQRILELKPEVVVIASASDIDFTQADKMRLHDGSATVPTSDPAATAALWARALNTSVTTLTDAGIRVLIVHPVPRFFDFDPAVRCTTLQALTDINDCGESRPRAELAQQRASAVEAELAAIVDNPLAASYDPFDQLCIGDPCSTNEGDSWTYRDWAHISTGASNGLANSMRDALAKLLA